MPLFEERMPHLHKEQMEKRTLKNMKITTIDLLTIELLRPLLDESLREGHEFVDRLWREYESDVNRFNSTGEMLLGVYDDETLIAIGALHSDPYLLDAAIGRIRHVYVLNAWRGRGVGRRLLDALIDAARPHYHTLTLRTFTPDATAFYNAIGFRNSLRYDNATHWLSLIS
jgi:GNAT superfamily N-acetyltransferase